MDMIFPLFVLLTLSEAIGDEHTNLAYNSALRNGKVISKSFSQSMQKAVVAPGKIKSDVLDIYCYIQPLSRSLWKVFSSICFEAKINGSGGIVIHEASELKVFEQSSSQLIGLRNFLPLRECVSPFVSSCFGVKTSHAYRYQLKVHNSTRSLQVSLLVGIVLFLLAGYISRSELLHYVVGMMIGLIVSVLLACLVVAQFFPKRLYSCMLGLSAIAGGSISLLLMPLVWINLEYLWSYYYQYVLMYVSVCSLVCFAYLYYRGPLTNRRLQKLIKWAVQAIALLLVYNGSHITEFSLTVMVLLVPLQLAILRSRRRI